MVCGQIVHTYGVLERYKVINRMRKSDFSYMILCVCVYMCIYINRANTYACVAYVLLYISG